MNNTLSSILSKIKECNNLMDRNVVDEAVILSGEALAMAYEQWSAKINNHSDSYEEINTMAVAASCHCSALAMGGDFREAYATAIGAILQISVDRNESDNISQSLLSIYTTATFSAINIFSQLLPDDEYCRDHAQVIIRYLSSMLYYYYNVVGTNVPVSLFLENAYDVLSLVQKFIKIDTPTITVLNKQIDPAAPHELIGDLIGRSQALSLLTDQ